MEEMGVELTGYGLGMMQKQMVAGANYAVEQVDITAPLPHPPETQHVSYPSIDPDISDHPRFKTANEILAAVPTAHEGDFHCFQVKILRTITNKPTSPHYVLLYDKVEGRECYKGHACTCGTGVRCGVPCRHFWAVLRGTTLATFHSGLVNDLWFKTSQKLTPTTVRLHTYDDPRRARQDVAYVRPLYEASMYDNDETMIDEDMQIDLAMNLTKKRLWGALLGEAKKAIERAIVTKLEDGLYAMLKTYALVKANTTNGLLGGLSSLPTPLNIQNPEVVRGKGRPKGTTTLGVSTGERPPPRKQALQPHRDIIPSRQEGEAVPDGVALELPQESLAAEDPSVTGHSSPPAKRMRRCGICRNHVGHDARNCPHRPK